MNQWREAFPPSGIKDHACQSMDSRTGASPAWLPGAPDADICWAGHGSSTQLPASGCAHLAEPAVAGHSALYRWQGPS